MEEKLKLFQVTITETLTAKIVVDAASMEQAEEIVRQNYRNEVYILDAENFVGADFSAAELVPMREARHSNYKDMVAFIGEDNKVYLGKMENYTDWMYLNDDNSLTFISDNQAMFSFLSGEGWAKTQDEMIMDGTLRAEDYMEFSKLRFRTLYRYPVIQEVQFAGMPFRPVITSEDVERLKKLLQQAISKSAEKKAAPKRNIKKYEQIR